ncbi:MAG TPA: hypothetical protein VMR59_01495 [Patescibacteria group bacterium]|nr:hypothetical protein [Patescibacteria group bacterium]
MKFLDNDAAKKLGQFLGIWVLIFILFIWFGIAPVTGQIDRLVDPLLGSAAIAALIYVGYWMGYDNGAKDVKTGNYKEPFVNPFA